MVLLTVALRVVVALATAAAAWGQGLDPRATAGDYLAHVTVGDLAFGAEFLGRGIPSPDGMFLARGYVVIELAVFGPPVSYTTLSPSLFSLKVNGSKQNILAQQPFLVTTTFDPAPAGTGPSLHASRGDVGVIVGDPGIPQRLPDPSGRGIPPAPPAPPRPSGDVPRYERIDPKEAVRRAALPSGELRLPKAGVLFFAFPKDTDTIRSLELFYEGPAGQGSIKLK